MIRAIAISILLFTGAVAFSGADPAAPADFSIMDDAAALPDFCETFKKVRNTATGEDDDSCPHGPTP